MHHQWKSHPDPSSSTLLIKSNISLKDMVQKGVIRPSSSPWCAPAVYIPKPNGELRICVDFIQLDRVTKKDSYPVPRADRPNQRLAGKHIFSKLDLKNAYWQFPMQGESIEKTAFCPGPGYGLWEFVVMPHGLTGATQTCQRGLDELFRECHDWVNNYVDDIIIFSDDIIPTKLIWHECLRICEQQASLWKDPNVFWARPQSPTLAFSTLHKVSPHPQIRLKSLQNG